MTGTQLPQCSIVPAAARVSSRSTAHQPCILGMYASHHEQRLEASVGRPARLKVEPTWQTKGTVHSQSAPGQSSVVSTLLLL